MSLWLTEDELIELTALKQRKKQCAELARMGVKFTMRHDGFPLVNRSQFEAASRVRREPDWSAIRS